MKNFKIKLKIYRNKKILITGHTGFKGSWLSFWLNSLGAKIYGISNNIPTKPSFFKVCGVDKFSKSFFFNIKNTIKLKKTINKIKPDFIFHLAAQSLVSKSYEDPNNTWETNLVGTKNILESLLDYKNKCSVIIITSDKCYKNIETHRPYNEKDILGGIDPYSASKASAEILFNSYFHSFFKNNKYVNLATARAGNVIGGGDWSKNRLIPDCINSIKKNKTIFLRNPYFNRPWQHVLEPLYGYLILAQKLYKNPLKYSGAWNFGSKKNTVTDVLSIVRKIVSIWGKGKIRFKKKNKYYEQTNLQLNINKAQTKLKWMPKLSIMKSVDLTIIWYQNIIKKKTTPSSITKKQIIDYMNDN